jgi:hypothetical protein
MVEDREDGVDANLPAGLALCRSVSQPYLSQLETGLRVASAELARRAARLYALRLTALPLPEALDLQEVPPDALQQKLASLGYPGFEHVRSQAVWFSAPS